jgi:hypothetical protein
MQDLLTRLYEAHGQALFQGLDVVSVDMTRYELVMEICVMQDLLARLTEAHSQSLRQGLDVVPVDMTRYELVMAMHAIKAMQRFQEAHDLIHATEQREHWHRQGL